MTPLRKELIDYLQLRGYPPARRARTRRPLHALPPPAPAGYSPRTVEAYVASVRQLSEYYWRPPDLLGEKEVTDYLLYLTNEKKIARGSFSIAICGIKLFYEQVLDREWRILGLAKPHYEKRLPVVLSREEVWRILDAVNPPGCEGGVRGGGGGSVRGGWSVNIPVYRVCLTTIYACGLRLMEGATLTVPQIDSSRMLVHIRGKGAKDRLVPLPEASVEMLRDHWRTHRSPMWLFPARHS